MRTFERSPVTLVSDRSYIPTQAETLTYPERCQASEIENLLHTLRGTDAGAQS